MADRVGALRHYLGSRKNIAGMAGALAGIVLHLAGLVGAAWPAVAIGLYAVGALIVPSAPVAEPEPSLPDALRAEVEAQLTRVELARADLPDGAEREVRRIVRTVRQVLERLEPTAAPDHLADAAEIVRVDLTGSLDAYLRVEPASRPAAARELGAQLEMIAVRAARLAARIPGEPDR